MTAICKDCVQLSMIAKYASASDGGPIMPRSLYDAISVAIDVVLGEHRALLPGQVVLGKGTFAMLRQDSLQSQHLILKPNTTAQEIQCCANPSKMHEADIPKMLIGSITMLHDMKQEAKHTRYVGLTAKRMEGATQLPNYQAQRQHDDSLDQP